MKSWDDVFPPGQKEQVINRIGRAVKLCPVTVEELTGMAEFIAAISHVGIRPIDVAMLVLKTYPHHVDSIREIIAEFNFSTAALPEGNHESER